MSFNATLKHTDNTAEITLSGELDAAGAPLFKQKIEEAAHHSLKRLVLIMRDLEYMASAGLRVLIFAKQKMGSQVELTIVDAPEMVIYTIKQTGFHHSIVLKNEAVL
ncbi:MAG: anti-sigma factor antagonist [Cyanophyceae cyanobacterium]